MYVAYRVGNNRAVPNVTDTITFSTSLHDVVRVLKERGEVVDQIEVYLLTVDHRNLTRIEKLPKERYAVQLSWMWKSTNEIRE